MSSLAFGAVAALAAGRQKEAATFADELLALHPAGRAGPPQRFNVIFDLAVALCELGRPEAVLDEAALAEVRTLWLDAAEAYARDELTRAADIYERSGALPFEAFARLRAAEQLVAEGRRAEAEDQLRRSLAFWRSVEATHYIREGEALLAAAS
jgi:thioredoxin-like negative regulator of GroEL